MAVCDCCGRNKADVKIRVGLRGMDDCGPSPQNPFTVLFVMILSRVPADSAQPSNAGCSAESSGRRNRFKTERRFSPARSFDGAETDAS